MTDEVEDLERVAREWETYRPRHFDQAVIQVAEARVEVVALRACVAELTEAARAVIEQYDVEGIWKVFRSIDALRAVLDDRPRLQWKTGENTYENLSWQRRCVPSEETPRHARIPTPRWDNVTRCSCGAEFVRLLDFKNHLVAAGESV